MFAKNKVGFVNGTIEKLEESWLNYMALIRCDTMVKGCLTKAIGQNIISNVKQAKIGPEIWSNIQERLGKESTLRAYELKQSLTTTHQEGMSVSVYYTKLCDTQDEIQFVSSIPHCTCCKCPCDIGNN